METVLTRLYTTMALAFVAACMLGIYATDWSVLLVGVLLLGVAMIGLFMFYVMRPVETNGATLNNSQLWGSS